MITSSKKRFSLNFFLIFLILALAFILFINIRFEGQIAILQKKISRTPQKTLELKGANLGTDTYIYKWSDGNDNYLTKSTLVARRKKDSAIFIKFLSTAFPSTSISSAILTLNSFTVENDNDGVLLNVYRILPEYSWNPNTIRWIDVDTNYDQSITGSEIFYDTTAVASFSVNKLSAGQTVSIDITNLMKLWAGGTVNNGLVIFNEGSNGQVDFMSNESTDTSKQPLLTLKYTPTTTSTDTDQDGILDSVDNCPSIKNADQADLDGDKKGNVCDDDADGDGQSAAGGDCNDQNASINSESIEICEDGIDQNCDGTDDLCPLKPSSPNDTDNDGITDDADNCPTMANPSQGDGDHDGQGDLCDNDDRDTMGSSDWSYVEYEALQKYKMLVDFWKARVAPTNDDFFNAKGGWNDDVELAASLTGYWYLTGDSSLKNMFELMADKIQEEPYVGSKSSPWVQPGDHRIEQGFTTVMLDVEHSAEETTLVFPKMTLIDYGEPKNIELMTRTIWNFQDNIAQTGYTEQNWATDIGVNKMLIRSPRYNARNVDFTWVIPEPDKIIESQDVAENFKTTMPGLSIAWYYGPNHYFWKDTGFMKKHANAWIEASKLTALSQSGIPEKPAYIPPSKILLTSKPDQGTWNFGDWQKNQSDPEGYDGGWINGAWVFRHLYSAMIADWMLFKNTNTTFATDASNIVEKAFHYRQNGTQITGNSLSLDRQYMQWRAEISSAPDDQLFLDTRKSKDSDTRMTAYHIYLERGDLKNAVSLAWDGFNNIRDTINSYYTSWTDEIVANGVTDDVKFEETDSWMMGSLGGAGIYDGAYPSIYMSLNKTDGEISTLMMEKSDTRIKFWAYNFDEANKEIGVRLWRLKDGSGKITIARDRDKDGQSTDIIYTADIADTGRGQEINFILPHHKLYIVTIEVTSPKTRDLSTLPDPAIGRKDYRYENGKVYVDVHNIGLKEARSIIVKVLKSDTSKTELGQVTIDLGAFTGMNPVIKSIMFDISSKVTSSSDIGEIVLEFASDEITKLNNNLKLQ